AEVALERLHDDMEELERDLADELRELADACDIQSLELESTEIPPRKSDLKVQEIAIVWTPWEVNPEGVAFPLYDNEPNQK
ncbi:MAG: hypothetical protein AAGJ83_14510, partial [Planctomycetota bacterium]